ncbi:MAG: carbon storage regulator CsrA [Schwartzia sp. (in: firmicutes)]
MLVLTRKPRQQIMIGDHIIVNVVEVQGDNVRIAIDAPREVKIYRGEIYRAIQEENQKAAAPLSGLDLSQLPKG